MAESRVTLIGELVEKRIVELQTGPFGSQLHAHDYVESGVPVVPTEAIRDRRIKRSVLPQISMPKAIELKKHALKEGDILFARRGVQATGHTAFVGKEEHGFICGTGAIRLRVTEGNRVVLPEFLSHVLADPASIEWFKFHAIGATMPNLNEGIVKSFPLSLPSLDEQRRIGEALSALDHKIELNRQMNGTLEEMARALFHDWFVDFGPTRRQVEGAIDPVAIMGGAFLAEKAATLAPLFPAAFGEAGLPEGWINKPLDEIGDFLNGLALQKYPAEAGKPDLPVIKIAELRSGVTAKSNRASTNVPEKYVIGNGDFIFSWSGSLLAKFWTGGPGALNQHLFKVTSESHPRWFVAEWVHTHLEEFQRIAASKAVTMGHIKRSHLSEAICCCPPREVLIGLGKVFAPFVEKQIANDEENQTLAEIRDLLLPKLMSGEIRVSAVEASS